MHQPSPHCSETQPLPTVLLQRPAHPCARQPVHPVHPSTQHKTASQSPTVPVYPISHWLKTPVHFPTYHEATTPQSEAQKQRTVGSYLPLMPQAQQWQHYAPQPSLDVHSHARFSPRSVLMQLPLQLQPWPRREWTQWHRRQPCATPQQPHLQERGLLEQTRALPQVQRRYMLLLLLHVTIQSLMFAEQ